MTKEIKLPEVGKQYNHLDFDHIVLFRCIAISGDRVIMENCETVNLLQSQDFFDYYEEIPEQEPTAENHIPDARKKVDKVQEAKDINVPTKSIWKPMSELRGDIMNIYIKWDDDLDIMPAQYSNRRKIIFANVGGETCQFECNYHKFKMWCTLSDFNNQVQDNTDRLDKLETKLNK